MISSGERGPEYGDLAERNAKIASKFDSAAAVGCLNWINTIAGTKLEGDFQEALKDGVALCKVINALVPNAVKINTSSLAFKQMENISNFLAALPAYGVRGTELFQTVELFEGTNLAQVVTTILTVKRISELKADGKEVPSQVVEGSVFQKTGKADKWLIKKKEEAPTKQFNQYTASEGAGKEGNAYGDLAERMARLDAKYDKTLEAGLRQWIETCTGESIGDDFQAGLKSGSILVKLANKNGGDIKINASSMAFKQMENIANFLKFCDQKGLVSSDKFQVVDLYEASNMQQVLVTLNALQNKCR